MYILYFFLHDITCVFTSDMSTDIITYEHGVDDTTLCFSFQSFYSDGQALTLVCLGEQSTSSLFLSSQEALFLSRTSLREESPTLIGLQCTIRILVSTARAGHVSYLTVV